MANELSFLELARAHPDVVKKAVKSEKSPYQVLRALGYGGQPVRARQLCEAVTYFQWDTSHWVKPVSATPVKRDFTTVQLEDRGEQGLKFEKKCYAIIDASELARENIIYREYELEAWQPLEEETPPWDAAILNEKAKHVILFEFKVSLRGAATLKKQLVKRQAWVEKLEAQGYTVAVVAVVGTRKFEDNKAWVKMLRAEGKYVCALSTFEDLLSTLVDS